MINILLLAGTPTAAGENHFVNKSNRSFQFWEREPMAKECWTKKFFRQKLIVLLQ
jgi:hypothetical protein